MTITRIGSNAQYASGWDNAFGGKTSNSSHEDSKKDAKKNGTPVAKQDNQKADKKKLKGGQ